MKREVPPCETEVPSVKDGRSAKAPRKLGRRSAQGSGSLKSGCKAGEEDCIEDK